MNRIIFLPLVSPSYLYLYSLTVPFPCLQCTSHTVFSVLRTCSVSFPCQVLQFSSVTQSCSTLCNPMNHSMPGFPVHHQLPELAQTHVHQVGDAIQPSYPLSSPSPSAFNLSQHHGLFQWVSSLNQVAKVLELQLKCQSFQWIFRVDFLAGFPCNPRDSQESSPTPQFKSIKSSVLSFLYSPTLTSIHDYWKNHTWLDGPLLPK